MNEAISAMLAAYQCSTREGQILALKEIMQELALVGLWRAKFFEHAAFYGGTSLRILYGLPRFSEDLDFSLLKKNTHFDLTTYSQALKRELQAFGFEICVEKKEKTATTSRIQSAFIKTNTLRQLIQIQSPYKAHREALIKIKLEVDTDPPGKFSTEVKQHFQPIPFSIRSFTLPSLFAGKLHACLCRPSRINVKGRDWYDFLWFISRRVPVDLLHLQKRMLQTGDWQARQRLTLEQLGVLLRQKIEELEVNRIKQEVLPFVRNQSDLMAWNRALFLAAAEQISEA